MKKRILLLLAVLLLCGCGTEKTYYCLNGELDGDECIIENYKDAIASCRDGYTKVGYVCKERKDAHSEINCREGYTAESGMCISNEPVEPEIKYECNDKIFPDTISHTLVENMCSYEVCLIREGGECLESTTMESPAITKEINCPKGTKDIYGTCRKIAQGKIKYSCDEGKLNGKYCILENSIGVIYSCEEGSELVGYDCVTKTRVPAKVKES